MIQSKVLITVRLPSER